MTSLTKKNKLYIFLLFVNFYLDAGYFDFFTDLEGKYSGHTTCNFLTIPSSATLIARGVSSSPGDNSALDISRLCANTSLLEQYTFAITHVEWLMGMRKEYLAGLFPFLDIGTLGFYLQMFTPGKIEDARNIDEEPVSPFFLEYSAGVSFSRSFFRNSLSLGVNLSFLESRIDELSGKGVFGGLDLRYSPHPFFTSHIYCLNFGSPISYSGIVKEWLPVEGGFNLTLNPFYGSLKRNFEFDFTTGVRKISDEPIKLGVSSKINTNFYLNFTIGYEHTLGKIPELNDISFGMGIKYKPIELNIGWKMPSEFFGNIWAFSLVYNTQELKKPTAEDYYNRAIKHYQKERYYFATVNAKRALRLDPNMWKAHALLNRIRSELLRKKNLEVAIIYTGNSQGNFVKSVKDNMGGFDRMGYVIKDLLEEYPINLLIEGGNIFKSDMNKIHAEFVKEYLDYIKYDVVGIGRGEIDYGVEEIVNMSGDNIKFVLSNFTRIDKNIVKYKIVEKRKYKFFIASLLNPAILQKDLNIKLSSIDTIGFREISKNCDFKILILHDNWENIQDKISYFNFFDFIICSNLESEFHTPLKKGNALLLSPGSKGKYVGVLTLQLDNSKRILNVNNRLIPLINDTPRDTFISKKLERFSLIDSSGYNNLLKLSLKKSDGVFPFISNRDGWEVIYVKDLNQLADFPISKTILKNCESPVISFLTGRIAFRMKDSDGCYKLKCTIIGDTTISFKVDSVDVDDVSFTPDGEWIYFSGGKCTGKDRDILRVKSIGGRVFDVIRWENSTEKSISFSPTDSLMAFCSNRDGSSQIYLTNYLGEKPIRLTDDNNSNYIMPKFSPNGRYIAYLSDVNNFGSHLDLWIYDRKDGEHKRITERANVKEFCWMLDSRYIVYTLNSVNRYEIIKADIIKTRFMKLIPSEKPKSWNERSPYVMKFGGKEYIIYTREDRESKDKQIFFINSDGSEDRMVVNSKGSDWLCEY